MSKDKKPDPKRCLTPEFRLSFPNLFKAKAFEEGQEAKFSLTMLFPKNTDLTVLKKAARAACVEKWGADEKSWPKNLRKPFRDGDEKEDLEGYPGMIFINTNSKHRPGVVDRDKNQINEEDNKIYAGCYCRATLQAYAYQTKNNTNRGVAFGLQNVQFLRDGEPFSGRAAAEDDFDALGDVEETDVESGGDSEDMGF